MKSYCNYCDPKHFIIYGFCKNCKRKCEAPLYDPKSGMNIEAYEQYKATWNTSRADLITNAIRRQS